MLIFIDIYIVFILFYCVGNFQFNHCNKTDPNVRFFPVISIFMTIFQALQKTCNFSRTL